LPDCCIPFGWAAGEGNLLHSCCNLALWRSAICTILLSILPQGAIVADDSGFQSIMRSVAALLYRSGRRTFVADLLNSCAYCHAGTAFFAVAFLLSYLRYDAVIRDVNAGFNPVCHLLRHCCHGRRTTAFAVKPRWRLQRRAACVLRVRVCVNERFDRCVSPVALVNGFELGQQATGAGKRIPCSK
jgi:hypothetical protein